MVYGCSAPISPGNMPSRKGFQDLSTPTPLLETRLDGRAPDRQGKVRDIFDLGDTLLLIASDRISAFDFVLGSGIPYKGQVLTQLSSFWFKATSHIVPHHLITTDVTRYPTELRSHAAMLAGRSMLVHKTKPIPVECVARGYLAGSGWKDYQATGAICGVGLPPGLRESERLQEPIFSPATKEQSGGHDINISQTEAGQIVGDKLIKELRRLTLALYTFGAEHAAQRGLILADTKFEFGLTPNNKVLLIDEAMTPDSSRYWPVDDYVVGRPQTSFDKQYVRDYLEQIGWNKQPPVPSLPEQIVAKTSDKYIDAFRRLTGQGLF
jgi:phosphoribosylaminoimidazole-succinocarboxamide synthase